jgi:hypothetical protein
MKTMSEKGGKEHGMKKSSGGERKNRDSDGGKEHG